MVVLMEGLARLFALIYTLEMGWRRVAMTSGACAQGAISGFSGGVSNGSAEVQGLV
jgi:hypothetical protein